MAFDYAMARHHRSQDVEMTAELMEDALRSLGVNASPEAAMVVAIQCLAQIMSCKS